MINPKPYILFGGDIMEHLDLISLIGNTGFPIAITAYLLIRLEKQLTSLSNSINTVIALMDTIIASNIFETSKGALISKYSAQVVQR